MLGRKRHLVVDTGGLLLGVMVTPADVSDSAGAAQLVPEVLCRHGWLRHFWADSGYGGPKLVDGLRELLPERGVRIEVVKRAEGAKGFAVQPRRWVIERTFGWLMQYRRLVRDYEMREVNSEAMIIIAMTKLMFKRLARRTF